MNTYKEKKPCHVLIMTDEMVTLHGLLSILLPSEKNPRPIPLDIRPYYTPTVDEAVAQLEKSSYDVVLVRKDEGIGTTTRMISRLKTKSRGARVLVMRRCIEYEDIDAALNAGASGYIEPTVHDDELKGLILKASYESDDRILSNMVAQALLHGAGNPYGARRKIKKKNELTKRERQVLQMMADGTSNTEIAAVMNISVSTVETHRKNILGKYKALNSPHAVRIGCERGSIPFDPQRNGLYE